VIRRAVLLFLLIFTGWAAPALATDYYFSNCGWPTNTAPAGSACDNGGVGFNGCTNAAVPRGSSANPWCLDPEGLAEQTSTRPPGSQRVSFAAMQDGGAGTLLTAELAPADNVYLCADACDGASTATYNLTTSGTYWLTLLSSGTLGNPISVKAFCDVDSCDTVILNGDSNNNAYPESTVDVRGVLTFAAARSYWTFDGRWDMDGVRHLIFERFYGATDIWNMTHGPNNFIFDGIEVRKMSWQMWSAQNVADPDCYDQGGNMFFINDLVDTVTFRHISVHHTCASTFRNNNGTISGSSIVEDSLFYNVDIISNDFNYYNKIFRRNTMLDFYQGISIEDNHVGVTIEDNIIGCPGIYRVDKSSGRCLGAINVNNGNNGASTVTTKDITIRRNRIFGQIDGNYDSGINGMFQDPPLWVHFNNPNAANNVLIENNMLWFLRGWDNASQPAISVQLARATGNEAIIQNNTVYNTKWGIKIDGLNAGVDYVVRNNLVVRSNKENSPTVGLTITANASTSRIISNLITNENLGGNIVNNNGTTYNCAGIAGFNNGGTRVGNVCSDNGAPTTAFFLDIASGLKSHWDLHLKPNVGNPAFDTGNATGPSDDIDGEARPHGAGNEIGADEDYGLSPPGEPNPVWISAGLPSPPIRID